MDWIVSIDNGEQVKLVKMTNEEFTQLESLEFVESLEFEGKIHAMPFDALLYSTAKEVEGMLS